MSHYTHLTIEERESILRMRAEKKGIREIARELQRSASTISREICRNAPWERGTNENTNGLLREFFPKGADLDPIPDSLFDSQIDLLNHRPRK